MSPKSNGVNNNIFRVEFPHTTPRTQPKGTFMGVFTHHQFFLKNWPTTQIHSLKKWPSPGGLGPCHQNVVAEPHCKSNHHFLGLYMECGMAINLDSRKQPLRQPKRRHNPTEKKTCNTLLCVTLPSPGKQWVREVAAWAGEAAGWYTWLPRTTTPEIARGTRRWARSEPCHHSPPGVTAFKKPASQPARHFSHA